MKKIFAFLLLGVFFLSFASAANWDNKLKYNEQEDIITIKNNFGWGKELVEATLESNGCAEGRYCEATKTITLYEETALIQDFKTLRIDDDSWEEQNIRWHKLEYWGEIDDYETECKKEKVKSYNGTYYNEVCEQVRIGSHNGWIQFKEGDIFKEGTYEVKTSGEIKPGRVYDWQVEIEGEWTTPWAIWGNISEGDDAEVILNSPVDESKAFTSPVTFNATANVTGGAALTNMSLWTNDTGSWGLRETKQVTSGDEINTYTTSYSTSDSLRTGGRGIKINARKSNTGFIVTKISGTTPTKVWLYNESGNYLADGTFSGNNATINYGLTEDTIYYLICDSAGGNWQNKYQPLGTVNASAIDFITGANSAYGTGGDQTVNDDANSHSVGAIYTFDTNISTISIKTFNRTTTDTTIWNVQACDSDGDCGFAPSNFTVSLDTSKPQMTIQNPTGTLDYNYIGNNEEFNVTFTDINLDGCWYNYNGTNISIPGCLTGVKNSTNFVLETDNTNMTVYANDTVGNLNSTFVEWNYTYLENNRTANATSYETASETFSINVEGATAATLVYNGTSYTTTKSGNVFTKILQVPTGNLGNRSLYWRFDDTQNSYTSYQNVSETVFTLCNTSYTTKFLNISFKDEEDLSVINASIPTSTFEYWLGDGTTTKTYTFINNTEHFNYEFCATPNQTFNFNSLIQYKQGTDYPQRVYSQDGGTLINATTNLTLYLLGVSDGLFVTFQVLNVAEQPISDINVLATRILEGSTTSVAQGTTDAAGSTTFWLNPDFQHTMTFSKTGLTTETLTIFPTQSAYTVSMGGGAVEEPDQTRGVSTVVKPQDSFLINDTEYNFNYTVSSTYWNMEEFGFTLFYSNGTEIGTESSTSGTGGILDLDANTLNSSYITMNYYYLINTTYSNGTRIWYIQNSEGTEYSIWNFFERFTTYTNAGLFGFDDFGKALISFLILVLVAGGLSFRYGLNSEVAIMGIIFGLVLVLDVGLGLIPNPQLATEAGLENIITIITGILLFGILVKEELR